MAEKRTAPTTGNGRGDEKGIQGTAPALAVQNKPAWADAARRRDLLIMRTLTERPEWLWEKILPRLERDGESGCLLWTGSRDLHGYGTVSLPRAIVRTAAGHDVKVKVHRVAHILATSAPVGYGLTLDHVRDRGCVHRNCCEPSHLEAVDQRTNLLRGDTVPADYASRTRCPNGHELEGGNLEAASAIRGQRKCRTCSRERNAEQSAAISAAHKALGLTQWEYRALFGRSRTTTERILDSLDRGVRPEVLVSGARAALAAAEREAS